MLKTLDVPTVRFVSTDHQTQAENPLSAIIIPLDGKLDLHKAVYNEIVRNFNGGRPIALELSTFCDAPAGSGLGSSSTLVVSMIKAFVEWLNLPLDDYTIARSPTRWSVSIAEIAGWPAGPVLRGVWRFQLHGVL